MIEEAIRRAIDCEAMLYNRKMCCPDEERDRELRWIYELAEIAPDGPAIECGVWKGGSLVCWAMARENRGPLFANDIKFLPEFTENMRRYNLMAHRLEMDAAQAGKRFLARQMAFCFIDANHRTGILSDIKMWPSRIMPNGVLAFHDYGVWKPWVMVKRVVDEWQQWAQWELLGQVGSLIAFRRPLEKVF